MNGVSCGVQTQSKRGVFWLFLCGFFKNLQNDNAGKVSNVTHIGLAVIMLIEPSICQA